MTKSAIADAEVTSSRMKQSETIEIPGADYRIGSVIRHFRTLADKSQAEVSKEMGYRTPEWLGMIEAHSRALDIEKAPKLARVLNINVLDFVTLVLCEQYPLTAAVLFPDREASPMRTAKNQTTQVSKGAIEYARLFEELPAEHQEIIQTMTLALMRSPRTAVRVNRSKLENTD
jgi:transcriptional regulator with XRE-family HTH domain